MARPRLLRRSRFLVIDGCPCDAEIAPYIWIVLRGAGQYASSIYRGHDPEGVAILHAHGKHDQAEIHIMYPAISNPDGRSQHDLHSDGFADPPPPGRDLPKWRQGVDSGTDDHASKMRINRAAAAHGWVTQHPYSRGVEGHHWAFKRRPRPKSLKMRLKIIHLRATLPRH